MALANGMWHKLKEELKVDGALLFGLLILAYLDIGGEHISLFFPFTVYVLLLVFLVSICLVFLAVGCLALY